ncbi:AAA family ATPase [Nonomuraea sp. NPDC059023]|uniref:AAA family ATPase n=1 Tax=unclassified Nonomuraea TaxID=2593643 RepID=UPI00368F6B39
MRPTDEQQAAIDAARAGKTIKLQAGAGCGKSTTLKDIALALPGKRILCVVYNKSVRQELARKMPKNVTVHTNHSFARSMVLNRWGGHLDRINGNRQNAKVQADILDQVGPVRINKDTVLTPPARARLAMGAVLAWCKSADTDLRPEHIPTPLGIAKAEDIQRLREVILPVTEKARADIKSASGRLKWQHDYYLKMAQLMLARSNQQTLPFDVVMMDECQDVNPVAASLYLDMQTALQRIIVGDSAQAINGWNGAIDILGTFPADQLLFLSKSFRFGPAVAEEANKWLTLLGAPLRLHGHEPVGSTIGPIERPDAVLCRTNAAAMGQIFDILDKDGTPALVGGGSEIASLAMAAGELKKGSLTDHPDLCAFSNWAELQDYVAQDPLGQDLKVFVELVDAHGVEKIKDAAFQVKDAAQAGPGDTIVCTSHKSKGLEWANVRVANDFRQPNPDAGATGETPVNREELMLSYVTVTRAMQRLDRGSLAWIDQFVRGRRHLAAIA